MKSELYLQLVSAFAERRTAPPSQFDEPKPKTDAGTLVAAMFNLPAEKAIEFMKSKGIAVTFDWRELEAKAKAKAFTIAKVTSLDLLQDVRNLIVKAQDEGKTFEQFKTEAQDAIAQRGWSGKQTVTKPDGTTTTTEITPSRLQTVYRTNMQTAYNAGRWQQIQDTKKLRPYLQFLAVVDDSTTEVCSKLNRKVFLADDPFWDTHMPPLHFNCRSTVRTLSEKQLQREKLSVESGKDFAGKKDFAPSEGFDSNPGKDAWQPDLTKYDKDLAKAGEKELAKAPEPPKETVEETVSRIRSTVKFADFTDDDILKAVDKYGDTAISELFEIFNSGSRVITQGDSALTMNWFKIKHWNNGKMSVEAELYNYLGDEVIMKRDFYGDSVYHNSLTVSPDLQRKGIAKEVWRESLQFYRKHGIKSVGVYAALDGGHKTWGHFGFKFDPNYNDAAIWKKEFGDAYAEEIKSNTGRGLTSDEGAELDRYVDTLEQPYQFQRKHNVLGVDFDGDRWKAKWGKSWRGVLELDDAESMQILNAKLGITQEP